VALIAEAGTRELAMQDREYAARIEAVKQRAHGRWMEILASLGVDERILKRRNPCPLCGGTDRFQYTDKFGEGNYHCRQCGPGGGFKLQAVIGVDFNTALRDVERCLGMMPVTAPSGRRAFGRAHEEAGPAHLERGQKRTVGDEVDRYLSGRGLALPVYPKVLRFHPALGYYQKEAAGKSRKVAEYPAMLACIQGADGHAVTLHRTYLRRRQARGARCEEGALGRDQRRRGPLVRCDRGTGDQRRYRDRPRLHLATGKPVWAGLNAGNLEKLWLPDSVRKVCIYADNDADGDFAGQAFAFALARRLKREEKRPVGGRCGCSCPSMPAPIGPMSGANAWKPSRRGSMNI
jgi:putative DNA primase/helicase